MQPAQCLVNSVVMMVVVKICIKDHIQARGEVFSIDRMK